MALAPRLPLLERAEQLAAQLPPILLAAERVAATVAAGLHGRRRVGPGEDFWQFRPYQPGDARQAIDWRRSARSEQLFIRQKEWEAAATVWIWRDVSPSMDWASDPGLPDKRRRAEVIALALAALLINAGERVGLLQSDEGAQRGRSGLIKLAEMLTYEEIGASPLPAPPNVPRPASLVLISDFLMPLDHLGERLKAYRAAGFDGQLVVVRDPAERRLPYNGRVRFHGLENEGEVLVPKTEGLREAYQTRMRARSQTLADLSRRAGWGLVHHETELPPETTLLALHQALSDTGVRR